MTLQLHWSLINTFQKGGTSFDSVHYLYSSNGKLTSVELSQEKYEENSEEEEEELSRYSSLPRLPRQASITSSASSFMWVSGCQNKDDEVYMYPSLEEVRQSESQKGSPSTKL